MHSNRKSFSKWIFLAAFLFAISSSIHALGDKDKDKSKPAPAAPQAQHPTNPGNAAGARANPGGNSGRPAPNVNGGRPATGTYNPGGNGGRPNSTSSAGTGKPNVVNPGHPTTSGTVMTGKPNSSYSGGGSGAPGGKPTTISGSSHKENIGGTTGTSDKGKGSGNYDHKVETTGSSTHGSGNPRGAGKGPEHGKEAPVVHREPERKVSHVGNHVVATDNRGHVREINAHDSHGREMVIHRGYNGGARFETRRNDGRRVVGFGRGRGFTERAYSSRNGRFYVQRTYVYGGRRYAVVYRSYRYHGVVFYRYAPAYYYHPVFYGWVYTPWAAPVYYRWGWFGDPWYPYYGYYFAPYPYYPNASLWLTDYLLAENLRLAYEARANADVEAAAQNAPPPPQDAQVTLTPEVKQMIAAEVQRQLAEERAAAEHAQSGGPAAQGVAGTEAEETPPALDPNQRIFIVANNVDLATDQGECAVTAGDVLMRTGTAPNEQNKIAVNVVTSKKGDCAVNTNADVDVAELQEMHNQFREKLDSGLKTLADNQGKNGLPAAPNTQTSNGEVGPVPPDPDAANELQDQQKSAEQTEQEVQKSSPGASLSNPNMSSTTMARSSQ